MNVAKKKRPGGRPRNTEKRSPRTINYSENAIQTLAALSAKFREDAPSYISVTDRAVIEALIYYADRENLSFEVLFGVTADAGK
jgi:hypothetical protein